MSKDVPVGYKLTEVGVIPEDWDVVEAWAACELVVDCKNRTPPVVESSDFAVVRTPNVRNGKFIREELRFTDEKSFTEWTARAVPQVGDVLVTREDPLGEVCLVPDDLKVCLGQRMMLYRPDAAKTDSIFLLYALMSSSVQNNLHKKIGGSTVGHARVDDIRNLQIPFPKTKVEQEAIATVLSDTDALITSLDKLIAKKRDIKQAAMQQLLTGKQRLEGFGDSSGKFKQTEIGLLPEDWDVQFLRETCIKIQDGTHFSPSLGGNDYMYVTSKNIGRGIFDISNVDKIDCIQHRKIYNRCDVKKGDLLLTKDGVNTGNAALNFLDEEFSLLSSVAFLRFDSSKYEVSYFLQQILSSNGQRQIKELMAGNAITRLTLGKIRSLKFPIPFIEEQQAIAKVLSDMDTEISALEQRRDKTKALKQAIMQELLTGRIRLV